MKLRDGNLQFQHAVEVQNCFSSLSVEKLDSWEKFKEGINCSAERILGFRSNARHEWLSDTTLQLVGKKRSARLAGR